MERINGMTPIDTLEELVGRASVLSYAAHGMAQVGAQPSTRELEDFSVVMGDVVDELREAVAALSPTPHLET